MCDAVAVLKATVNVFFNQAKLTSRNAAKEAISYMMGCYNLTCENHKVINVFFNSKRKISTVSLRKDNVASFKKQKRETIFL